MNVTGLGDRDVVRVMTATECVHNKVDYGLYQSINVSG